MGQLNFGDFAHFYIGGHKGVLQSLKSYLFCLGEFRRFLRSSRSTLGMLGFTRSARVWRADSLDPQFRLLLVHDSQATSIPLLVPHVRACLQINGLIVREKRDLKF